MQSFQNQSSSKGRSNAAAELYVTIVWSNILCRIYRGLADAPAHIHTRTAYVKALIFGEELHHE